MDDIQDEDPNCSICKEDVGHDQVGVLCEMCNVWTHKNCLHLTEEEYTTLRNTEASWFCARCLLIKSNRIKWGTHEGEESISNLIKNTYDTIIGWRKNIFMLPRGKCGTDFIKELTRLINLFNHKTKWERVALSLVHIFLPIMLQKPNAKSKPRDHSRYLSSRLERWSNGDITSLLNEAKEIQKRMAKSLTRKQEARDKAFIRLMMLGKVGPAAKFINNDDSVKGVHQVNEEIKNILNDKHPKGREIDPTAILPDTAEPPQPVIYEEITADRVQKAARNLKGSGGPSLVDADTWRDFLCSKVFGNVSLQLCQSIADLAKILCIEEVHPDCLIEYLSCRLIPLDKGMTKEGNPGVRPIGIGEILRRLIGKILIGVIKEDIMIAIGPLQTCSGIKSGIEGAIHAMRRAYEDDTTEAILLVDAENAFNNLNRKVALHNVKQLCPPLYQYLSNTYQKPAKLVIPGENKYEVLYSDEGTTQGDVTAMAFYGLGLKPLTDTLSETVTKEECKQSWYADDSFAAGVLTEIRKWWDQLCNTGPKYGYFPLPTKTVLIVKEEFEEKAKEIFYGTGVKITTQGERHLGAVIGSPQFRKEYVLAKVEKWVEDIEELATIAKEEPQAALASFTKAISHRWTFLQRTVPNIGHLFQPLENIICEKLIPALVGRRVSEQERNILGLPVRLGGIGLTNPVTAAAIEYSASTAITTDLSEIIYKQEKDFTNFDKQQVDNAIKIMKQQKELHLQERLQMIMESVDDKMKRHLELAKEKGSGAWLTTLPVKSLGYTLNKQEFRDSICLRYGWKIANTPSYCQCGVKNDINHTLSCKKGGYVAMRHNNIRDLEADLMREVCKDVKVVPELLPLDNNQMNGNIAEKARLDVSGNGVWGPLEKTFLDIRIMHPNAPSYIDKNIAQVYNAHEKEKKRMYNERVLQVEKGSFTPIVMSTYGGMGNEANRHHKRIATLIAEKRNENYADVLNYIRTRLRFCLLKSVLLAIRGVRGKTSRDRSTSPISSLSFNLIEFNDGA